MTSELVIYGAGKRDPLSLDPTAMQFTAQPATSCRGCLFNGQWWRTCCIANEVAVRAGLQECEAGNVIYVTVEIDPRQLALIGGDA